MTTELSRTQALAKADAAAAKRLREEFQKEFNEYKQAEAEALGHEWTPRLTGTDKARAELAKLLNDNPQLRQELVSEVEQQIKSQPAF